jgi:aldose 1-epimerase
MNATHSTCGTTASGEPVASVVLSNRAGMAVTLWSWGALIQGIRVPDRSGQFDDVVLGFDTLSPYLGHHPSFGVTVGRYANRIAHAKFTLDGVVYPLSANNGPNALHGGPTGFSRRNWAVDSALGHVARFTYTSVDGEEGYPGNLRVATTYTLDEDNGLEIAYEARTDRATVLNLTNHSYFNLAGRGDVLDHEVTLFANAYLPVDAVSIPTGELRAVAGTPMDFRAPARVGARIADPDEELRRVNGFDHTFVLGASGAVKHAARVFDPRSGRMLDVHTTQPGIQFYTANNLDGTLLGKGGAPCVRYGGLCHEAHHFPDAPNQPAFPTTVLRPGDVFHQRTVYRFSIAHAHSQVGAAGAGAGMAR